jgi:hypothetical protein
MTDEGGRMGRGRQRAKQRRNARKLKYLTTDTDYAELQRELSGQGADDSSADQDPFGQIDEKFQHEREMDEYAKWAAESAAKAKKQVSQTARPRKPIPSGLFAAMLKSSHDGTHSDESNKGGKGDKNGTAAKSTASQPAATTKEKPSKKSAQSTKARTSHVKSTAKKSTTRTASARKTTIRKTATRKTSARTAAAQKTATRTTTARKTTRTTTARAKKAKTSKTSSTRSPKSAA